MPDDLDLNRLRALAEAAALDWDSAIESGVPTIEGWAHMKAAGHPQTTLALIEKVEEGEEWQQATKEALHKAHSTLARATKAEAERDELRQLVYVPGLWRCAKCEFQLVQANLNAADGSVTTRDEPGDKCPNCDAPLWRVTERPAGNDMVDRAEEQMKRAIAAETELERVKAQLAEIEALREQVRPPDA